jgi:thermitase
MGEGTMREKIICVLMLTLILTSALGMAFVIRPSFAEDGENSISGKDFMEKKDEATLPNEITKPYAEQEKTLESSRQTSRNSEDEWNFNDTNEWTKFAYLDGNRTRLIVGAVNDNPASLAELEKIAAKYDAEFVSNVSIGGQVRAVVVELSLASVTAFVEDIRTLDLASYVEPNMKVQAQLLPNDPYWTYQWGLQKIEADWAWNTTIGDPSVLVAVVDTGIDYYHPDLAANYAPLGYDWVNRDADPMDDHGHGTHCAGIIAAVSNNSAGIAGLAQVRVMAEKVLDSSGEGTWDSITNGIINATDSGADIISMSLGGYGDSELVHEAVKYAYDAGVLVIAAAGNDNTNMKLYPAGYDEVIAVAATDQYDNKAWFSNWGDWIELAAPGVDIYSAVPWGYESWSGTSMATPHVSGVAALVWSRYPSKTRDWVRPRLRYTADDLGDPCFDAYYGYGRVNARKAVEQTPPDHELIAYEWRTPPYVKPGATGIINATILNFGEEHETDVAVQLLANDTMVAFTIIDFLASGGSTTVSLAWNPAAEGLYNVTLYVVPVPGETSLENNGFSKSIYVGFPVKAAVLHSAGNVHSDIITNWQVLTNEWYLFGDTMVYIDYTTLNKEGITYEDVVATEADVLIISCAYDPYAGWQFTDSEIEAITQYVHEGHGLIATAGTLYYMVPNNNKLAPLFGLSETTMWSGTGTDLLHLLNTTHPIFANVPNPLIFRQAGTALPYDGRWDSNELVGGKYLALGHFQESAVVVYRGLVYISPWLEVIPPYYHHHLQLLYNAITWSRYQKPQHELAVSLEAPKRLNPGEPTQLNATVFNRGRSDEASVVLQLFVDGLLVDSVTITDLLVDSSYTLSHLWTSTVQGMYNVTAYAPPISGEEFTENNISEKQVLVLLIAAKSVLVYADDYAIAPSSRYVIVALDNLGIDYTYYSDDPGGFAVALVSQPWDLVVVDHCNYYAMGYYWTELEEYVRNGGLLVLSTFDIDGSHSEPTTLWDTLGVRWVSDMWYPEPVYRWMPSHSIFTFPNTVGDLTSYMEAYSDDGDHVASTTGTAVAGFTTAPSEGYASVVVGNVYRTVLFSFTLDEFRYDQDGDGKLDAVELWENAIVYANTPVEHDIAVNMEAPKSVKPSQSALLNATVFNKGLSNETDVELQILVNGAAVQSTTIYELLAGDSYTLTYLFIPTVEGIYNVTAYALPVPCEGNIQNNVKSERVTVSTLLVALFQNWHPWDYPSNEEAFDRYGIPYVVFSSGDFGTVDLSMFTKVVIASDQDQTFYNAMDAYRWWFEDYVRNGGVLEMHAACWGWHGGGWIGPLPGGLEWASYYVDYVTIVDYTHPVVTTPNPISDAELDSWSTSVHGYFRNYPANSHIVIIEDSTMQPAYIEFEYGNGFMVASSQTLEWAYKRRLSLILENNLLYVPMKYEHDLAVTLDAPVFLELDDSTLLNVTVRNRGLKNETDVELYLVINGTLAENATIPELLVGESYTIGYIWTPARTGNYNITTYARPVPGEEYVTNNIVTRSTYVFSYAQQYVPHQWIGGGVPMGWHADDASWNYTLPFDFPFYEMYYKTIYISSNGLITFTRSDPSFGNNIPALSTKFAIAPAWDDWMTYDAYDIYIWQNSTHVGIRWYVAALYNSNITASFEAILSADGLIQLNYGYNSGTVSATIGISNGAGHVLAEDVASINYINTIVFTPFKRDVAIYNVTASPNQAYVGQPVNINATVANEGGVPETFTVKVYYENATDEPHSANAIWIKPSFKDLSHYTIGQKFKAEVWLNLTVASYAWQICLIYDKTILNARRCGYTAGTTSQFFEGLSTVPVEPLFRDVNETDAYILYGECLLGLVEREPGYGSLCWVEFEIVNRPPEPYQDYLELGTFIYETFVLDPEGNDIPITRYHCIYGFGVSPPTPPPSLLIGEQEVYLLPGSNTTLTFTWNTIGISFGNYTINAFAEPVPGETDIGDNTFVDGVVEILWQHDVALTDVSPSQTWLYQSRTVTFNVTVMNKGDFIENVTITLYYNITSGGIIGEETITNLLPSENKTVTLVWDTTGVEYCHNYTLTAVVSIPADNNPADNTLSDGNIEVRIMGDINGDGKVDGKDIALAALCFGSAPGYSRWNPDADVNADWKIDGKDIVKIAINFGLCAF